MEKFQLTTFANADELARAAASAWLDQIQEANRAQRRYCAALSGGRISNRLFASLTEQTRQRNVNWANVHIFWADERCVPPADSESNFKTAQQMLFQPLDFSEDQIHRIRGEMEPAAAAHQAEIEIRRVVPLNQEKQPVLDLVFLGLGEDGHVASLFPGEAEELTRNQAVYRAVLNSPKPPPERVTLGYPALAAAKQVWMLASGEGKKAALEESLSPTGNTPFANVLRLRASTKIFIDFRLS